MSTAESRRVALQWLECSTKGRYDDLSALTASEMTWWISGLKETLATAGTYTSAERKGQMKKLFAGPKSFKFTVIRITAEGDTVVVEGFVRFENEEARVYKNDVILKFVVKDGKLQSLREYVGLVPHLIFRGTCI